MLELYRTKNENVHRKVEILLERRLGKNFEIKRNENGKPFIDGQPLYFSLSHSHRHAVIALCDKPVGVDLEFYGKNKNFTHILNRFTEREKQLIASEPELFFCNWVSKEAYVKMNGGTLAHFLKRLEFYDDSLYLDGEPANCGLYVTMYSPDGICAVCAEGYSREQLSNCRMKVFRLKKNEKLF